jgi:hypothetical protein
MRCVRTRPSGKWHCSIRSNRPLQNPCQLVRYLLRKALITAYGCCAFQKASSTVETSVSPDRTTVVTCVLRYRHKLKLESEGQEAFAQVSGSVSTKLDP